MKKIDLGGCQVLTTNYGAWSGPFGVTFFNTLGNAFAEFFNIQGMVRFRQPNNLVGFRTSLWLGLR